jgi:hypothetical protein
MFLRDFVIESHFSCLFFGDGFGVVSFFDDVCGVCGVQHRAIHHDSLRHGVC